MKKYSSGSFIDAAVRVYGSEADNITSFPASLITNDGNITPWSIYGNTVNSVSVGDKTNNIFNGIYANGYLSSTGVYMTPDITTKSIIVKCNPNTTYTIHQVTYSEIRHKWRIAVFDNEPVNQSQGTILVDNDTLSQSTVTTLSNSEYIVVYYMYPTPTVEANFMINEGETALPYEPYGYKLPVVIGSTTTNIYMADVLRMSSGADPVYDVMSSTGVITRNVDTDGSPLPTPTTESFTAPTLATTAGSQSFTIDTTVKPSSVSLTYTGWHTHSDKQYSGGSWGQVTSNAKVLRRKRTAKSKA